jgi:probable FeS assembly SUF system protein SufT
MTSGYETVKLTRDCDAILIPNGISIHLQKDTEVVVFQSLGDSFTININGNLARLAGKDGDAIGKEAIQEDALKPSSDTPVGEVDDNLLIESIKQCYDPEIPVNIVDLGLVYSCKVTAINKGENLVEVKMTLTAPGCGMGPVIVEDVRQKALRVPNVTEVEVELVFDPPWDRSMMSEAAQLALGMY